MSTASPNHTADTADAADAADVAVGGREPADLAAALRADANRVAAVTEAEGDAGAARAQSRAAASPAFGLQRMLPEGSEVHTFRVASYEDKLACIDAVDRFAAERELRGKYREAIVQCVDELLMNALYAAPRAAAQRMADVETLDAAAIAARAHRGVQVSWALVDRVLYVSALDSYGSLERRALLDAMSEESGANDAGLGVRLIAGSCSQMWVSVADGEVSECVCAFDTRAPRMQLAELGFVWVTDKDEIAEIGGALERSDLLARQALSEAASPSRGPIMALGVAIVVVLAIVLVLLLRG